MSNWTQPTNTTNYLDVLGNLKQRDDALATMFEGTAPTNIPVNTVRLVGNDFQRWNGTSWTLIGTVVSTGTQTFTGNKTVSGNLTVSGDINNSSDAALKENIVVVENALDKLEQISGVAFDWKASKDASMGVIAQEVEKVFPQLVSETLDGSKAVNYLGIIAVLIEAVKELNHKLDNKGKKKKRAPTPRRVPTRY
jgi:hypothetical protein